ncbi:MAG TPA: crotonase/enoyl-CoA hydratase family protein [Acidimicrobiales bacterium]|nr:crotonase/enoyl-CoA hydratase family protein [Acidimicrobiales bacterium]
MSDRVAVTIDGGVADVRLNRPEKMNALDTAMFQGIVEAGRRLAEDRSVRAVVLSGEGRAFCAGLDFSSFQAMASAGGGGGGGARRSGGGGGGTASIGETDGRITHLGQEAAYVWHTMPAPVIAAVHGVALGGGIQIALGADIRIVAPDARMSVLEIRWGLIPDMTGTAMLPRLVGLDVAKELTFTGRMVSGEEAVRIGLATKVAEDPRAEALALAREIAGKSPSAVRGAKRLLNQSGLVDVAQQFADERSTIGSLIGGPEQVEAVTAYFEKRDPVFKD